MTRRNVTQAESPERSRIASIIVALVLILPIAATLPYGAVDSMAIGIIGVLAAVMGTLWIIDSLRAGEFRFSANLLQLPVIGLILIGCIQLLPLRNNEAASEILGSAVAHAISLDPYATRFFVIHLAVYFLFFAVALAYVPGDSRPKRVAVAIVVFGAAVAFFGILQRLGMPDAIYGLRTTPQAIPFGPFVNQHHFAALMQMTSGIALGLLFGAGLSRERKVFVALAAGVMGMAIIFTGSRAGLMSYFCVVALAAAGSFVRRTRSDEDGITSGGKRNLVVLIAAAGLIVLVLASVLFLGGQESLFRGIGLQQGQADVTSGRMHFWSVAWQIFLAHPIIGSGFDAFGVAFSRFDTWNGFFRVDQAHNDYLQMLADGGILGFACVAAFVVLFIKKGVSAVIDHKSGMRRSIITGAMAGCCGVLVHSFFDFPLRTPANAFFFLLLAVLVVGNAGRARSSHRSA